MWMSECADGDSWAAFKTRLPALATASQRNVRIHARHTGTGLSSGSHHRDSLHTQRQEHQVSLHTQRDRNTELACTHTHTQTGTPS